MQILESIGFAYRTVGYQSAEIALLILLYVWGTHARVSDLRFTASFLYTTIN